MKSKKPKRKPPVDCRCGETVADAWRRRLVVTGVDETRGVITISSPEKSWLMLTDLEQMTFERDYFKARAAEGWHELFDEIREGREQIAELKTQLRKKTKARSSY